MNELQRIDPNQVVQMAKDCQFRLIRRDYLRPDKRCGCLVGLLATRATNIEYAYEHKYTDGAPTAARGLGIVAGLHPLYTQGLSDGWEGDARNKDFVDRPEYGAGFTDGRAA
jgi:hypothetical protein